MTGRNFSGGSEGRYPIERVEGQDGGYVFPSVNRSQRRNPHKGTRRGNRSVNVPAFRNVLPSSSSSSSDPGSRSSVSIQNLIGAVKGPSVSSYTVDDPANYFRLFKIIKRDEKLSKQEPNCTKGLTAVIKLLNFFSDGSKLKIKSGETPFSCFLKKSLDDSELVQFADKVQIITLGARLKDMMK